MPMRVNTNLNDENINHLESSTLKITGTNGKPVKLYRYIGSTSDSDWEYVREYFFYVTPEYVLRNGITGFKDYGQIGWYCKHKDVFIVEQRLDVPIHLTIGYRERIKRSEAGEWYQNMQNQTDEKTNKILEIKSWFTEAVYPEDVRDYVGDIIDTSHIYLIDRQNFFEEGSVCFLIREDQDFIAMFVNLEYSKSLGNCIGLLDGIFCYLDFDPELADLINEWCIDETDDFRELFVREKEHYAYTHDPIMWNGKPPLPPEFNKPPVPTVMPPKPPKYFGHQEHHHCPHCDPPKPHEKHSGCTKKKPWEDYRWHY